MRNQDREFRLLASISSCMEVEYDDENDDWRGSPFAWILPKPSRQKGAIAERLVAGWLAARGFGVTRSPDSDADRVIEGKRVEIKFSTLWKGGHFKFQQLRDQNYDFVICLGVAPFDAYCWVIPKPNVLRHWREGDIHSQHGGASGTDTAWIDVEMSAPHAWLGQYGGSLSQAISLVSSLTGYEPGPLDELDS